MSATWQSQSMRQTASRLTPKTSSAPATRPDLNHTHSGKSSWHPVSIQTSTTRIRLRSSTCHTDIRRTCLRATHGWRGMIWMQMRRSTMQTFSCPPKWQTSTTMNTFDKRTFNRSTKKIHILEYSVWRCCRGRESPIPYGFGQASLTSLQALGHSSWQSTKSYNS